MSGHEIGAAGLARRLHLSCAMSVLASSLKSMLSRGGKTMKKFTLSGIVLAVALMFSVVALAQDPATSQPTNQAPTTQSPSTQSPSATPSTTPSTPTSTEPQATTPSTSGAAGSTDMQSMKSFSGKVVKDNGKLVLKDASGMTYQLDDQDKAKQFEGKDVKV